MWWMSEKILILRKSHHPTYFGFFVGAMDNLDLTLKYFSYSRYVVQYFIANKVDTILQKIIKI